MTGTTKGSAASTTNPFSTDRANGPHHIPHTSKEYKDMTQPTLTPSNLDSWTCPVCGWETHAAGPVDVDEPDPWMDEVDAHRATHDTERDTVGEVPVVEIWTALQQLPGLMDLLARAADLPRADVARVLHAVADVIDAEVTR